MSTTPKYSRLAPGKRREQILDAANALFAERGYDEVSVEDIASSAGVTRGLVHHYFGGRKEVYIALLERLGAMREEQLPPPVGPQRPRPRGRQRVALARLDRAEPHDLARPRSGAARTSPTPTSGPSSPTSVRRAVALLAAHHADIADDSPRLRYALECWTGLNRSATRRWLQGEATREQTHELIASTLEHVLRTFGAPPKAKPTSLR